MLIGKLRRFFGRVLRTAVAWSFLATALRFGSALFVLPLILRRVPSEELGLWYVFLSFGALATLVDFGFAPTITRVTSYLWAGARELSRYGLPPYIDVSDERRNVEPNLPLLSRLVAALKTYYALLGAAALFVLLTIGGWWIYRKTFELPNAQSLRIAFVVYSIAVALNLMGGMWLYTLNGINRVRESSQLNAAVLLENYLIAIAGLLAGFRIWALVIANLFMGVTERIAGRFLFYKYAPIQEARTDLHMLDLLWPNAWRTGIVSVATYFGLQANTLICSAFLGLKITGSYGLTFQAITLLVAVSTVWVVVKFPFMGQLRAQGRLEEIAKIFRQRIVLAMLTYIIGAAALLFFGRGLLALLHTKTQFLPLPLLATMLLIYLLEVHHSLYAALVVSENVNPFVIPGVISGAAIVGLSLLLTPRFGVWGMLLSQGIVQLSFNNWWPVVRAIRGLAMNPRTYWLGFLDLAPGGRTSA